RLLLAGLVLALPACSLLQQAPDSPASPAAQGEAASPARAAPGAPGAPAPPGGAGDPALAQPDLAMRWTLHLPSDGGRPWTRQHFEVKQDGSAIWESDTGG